MNSKVIFYRRFNLFYSPLAMELFKIRILMRNFHRDRFDLANSCNSYFEQSWRVYVSVSDIVIILIGLDSPNCLLQVKSISLRCKMDDRL